MAVFESTELKSDVLPWKFISWFKGGGLKLEPEGGRGDMSPLLASNKSVVYPVVAFRL